MHDRRIKIGDNQLACDFPPVSFPGITNAVTDIQPGHPQTIEHLADIRMVVDADDDFALAAAHESRHVFVFGKRPVKAVPFRLPIRRVEIEQRVWPVVAFNDVAPGQVFDIHAR